METDRCNSGMEWRQTGVIVERSGHTGGCNSGMEWRHTGDVY